MIRNVFGSLIALIGATAAAWSPFRAWYDGRHGSKIRIEDLFNGITADSAALMGSLFLPMIFAALVTLLGLLLRSRLLVGLSGIIVLGFTILWMVRQGQAAGSLTAGGNGLDAGVGIALAGGALLLIAAAMMSGRHHPSYGRPPVHPIDPSNDPAPTQPAAWDPPAEAPTEWTPSPPAGSEQRPE
ncbi:hypothetical protein QMK19_22080 [Streptomyces sp. H10-C2]|uniref:hypothetical protein n=1 Tax=unclassified Streptomyces TaxID=2593676 RepID=UPI0024B93281|nr:MULTISPECIES: hypothetical protein [unclassified Streptomyces]MDJ0342424.1 hypothetical protein [Streptomyces sp. PH10-H1]MDJ0372279.1 hypothetical protein [Streptomyces sp. H10-C2]